MAILDFVYHTSVLLTISKELHNVGNYEINSSFLQYNVVSVMIYQTDCPEIWLWLMPIQCKSNREQESISG